MVFGGVVGGTVVGETGEVGVVGIVTASLPNFANGFGLPSFPSGISTILESRKVRNAGSDKIASSNFIFLTFNNRARKSLATKGATTCELVEEPPMSGNVVVDGDTTKFSSSGDGLIKKIYIRTKVAAMAVNIMMFLIFGIFLFLILIF